MFCIIWFHVLCAITSLFYVFQYFQNIYLKYTFGGYFNLSTYHINLLYLRPWWQRSVFDNLHICFWICRYFYSIFLKSFIILSFYFCNANETLLSELCISVSLATDKDNSVSRTLRTQCNTYTIRCCRTNFGNGHRIANLCLKKRKKLFSMSRYCRLCVLLKQTLRWNVQFYCSITIYKRIVTI